VSENYIVTTDILHQLRLYFVVTIDYFIQRKHCVETLDIGNLILSGDNTQTLFIFIIDGMTSYKIHRL